MHEPPDDDLVSVSGDPLCETDGCNRRRGHTGDHYYVTCFKHGRTDCYDCGVYEGEE